MKMEINGERKRKKGMEMKTNSTGQMKWPLENRVIFNLNIEWETDLSPNNN